MQSWQRRLRGLKLVLFGLLSVVFSFACAPHANELGFFATAASRSDRPLRLRIHVSGTYAAQPLGTHAHIRRIVQAVDRVFWSSVGAHVVVEEIVDGWKVDVGQTQDALTALIAEDAGDDVDVVVGMLGAMRRRRDECGGRALVGRDYMVVRSEDADSAANHRFAVALFLHELGHALGAHHDATPGSIMNGQVTSPVATFTDASVQLIQSGLARRGIVAEPRSAFAIVRVTTRPIDANPIE